MKRERTAAKLDKKKEKGEIKLRTRRKAKRGKRKLIRLLGPRDSLHRDARQANETKRNRQGPFFFFFFFYMQSGSSNSCQELKLKRQAFKVCFASSGRFF